MTPVIVPDLGLPPDQPVTLSVWYVQEGDFVYEGDRLAEVLLPGATFDVAAPAAGRIVETLIQIDEPVSTGRLLALIQPEDDD